MSAGAVEVSLVMPAFRPRADWLRDAVASALDGPGCEVELIIVDDGSPEPVASLLDGFGDPRLRVVESEHGGPYAARNAGIATARGDHLRFVDADDIVVQGSTGRLLALARSAGESIAYGATLMCDESLNPQREVTSEREGWVVEDCVMGHFDVYIVSMLFPRAVVERAGPWEAAFRVSGDWDFGLRALEQAPVRRLDEVVTLYRRHGTSITKSADVAAGAAAGRLVLERFFERHPERRGTPLERRAFVRLHLDRAGAHAAYGERGAAARELGAAARRSPAAVAAATWRRVARRVRNPAA